MFTETFVKLTIHAHDFALAISISSFQEHARGREALLRQGGKVVFLTCRFSLLLLSGPMVPCQKARKHRVLQAAASG